MRLFIVKKMSSLATTNDSLGNVLAKKTGKYLAMAKVAAADRITYFLNIFARSATIIVRIWIFTQLYEVTYQAAGVEQVNGLAVPVIIWILMLTQSFGAASRPTAAFVISEEVKSGALTYQLGRPYSYLLFQYASHLGRYVPNTLSSIAIGIVATLLLVGTVSVSWQGLVLGLILLVFGITLDFLMNACMGLAALWVEDATPFQWIYQKAQMAFGGMVFPIALFPEKFRAVAELLPFSQCFYSAARIMVKFDAALFGRFILIQMVWVLVLGLMAVLIFKRGTRNVSINGG